MFSEASQILQWHSQAQVLLILSTQHNLDRAQLRLQTPSGLSANGLLERYLRRSRPCMSARGQVRRDSSV